MVISEVIYSIKSRFKLYYAIFMVAPKVWRPPQKCDVLIYDKRGSEALAPYLEKYRTEIASVNGESINLYCLLHAIFKANFWRGRRLRAYMEVYITTASPRLCITFVDENTDFYTISDSLSGVKTMLLQNGLRDDWLEVHTDKSLYKVDFMLVFNKSIGSIYERHINGKIVLAGSLKNNFIEKTTKLLLIPYFLFLHTQNLTAINHFTFATMVSNLLGLSSPRRNALP